MGMLNLAIIVAVSYLLGSIPSSIWISKLFYKIDIREHGSGNAGGTNVFRVLGWRPAVFVIVIDIAKGFAPTFYAAHWVFTEVPIEEAYLVIIAGFAAVLGHCFTVFARFRGGKGVATAGGMLLALYPSVLPVCLLVFIAVVLMTRFVSLASMSAAAALPLSLLALRFGFNRPTSGPLFVLSFVIVFFIFYTHRANIARLFSGTENKISWKKVRA